MVEISVIIPVYNCEEFLDESLGGIINQTFKDIEIICVDDGSTDNSLFKLKDYAKRDNRIQVYHQENQGGGNARNFALTKATGKYLYFMDADDILYTNALERCYGICEEKNLDFLVFKAINYNQDTEDYEESSYFTMDSLYEYVGDEVFSIQDIGDKIFEFSVTPWGKLYNRSFIINSGAQFAEKISFHDNKFFWEMLFNSKRIFFLNETYYVRRVHSKSLVGSKNRGYFNSFIAFGQVFDLFKKYGYFEEFKSQLYNWKIRVLYRRFRLIHKEYKQEFLDKYKQELLSLDNSETEMQLLKRLSLRNKTIYKNVIKSETVSEFQLSMKIYEQNQIITDLKKKNKNLKKENKKYKCKLNQLLNSKSWKLTKPLRKIKNLR